MARTLDIDLNSKLAKDVPSFGRTLPLVVDRRNTRKTDTGDDTKRPGYLEEWDTGVDVPIKYLIPESTGYSIDKSGNIFKLGSVPINLYTLGQITSKPTHITYEGETILGYGGVPVSIIGGAVTHIPDVPYAKFIVMIKDHAIYLGYHPTEFTSSVPGNPKSVDLTFGARKYNVQKSGTILNAINFRDKLMIFKEKEIEVWDYRAGDPPFVTQPGASMDVGLGAVNSVVRADERIWFFGDDGDFYEVIDFVPVKISTNYKAYLTSVTDSTAWEGYDIAKENIIMWINRESGKTLSYDYLKKEFLEDNWWHVGCWESLPFSAYMELNGKQLFGSSRYDGLIHDWSYNHKDDNGVPIRVTKEFVVPLSQRGFNARVSKLKFRRLGGLGNSTVTDPVFLVRTNFDREGWSDFEHMSLGTEGDHNPFTDLDAPGLGREMAVEIAHTDATEFLITNIYATVEAGNH